VLEHVVENHGNPSLRKDDRAFVPELALVSMRARESNGMMFVARELGIRESRLDAAKDLLEVAALLWDEEALGFGVLLWSIRGQHRARRAR
jgi:tRNA-binding EMAP/Myf-like protein